MARAFWPLRFASRSEVGGPDREAPGVRPCRAAAHGHRTSGCDLPLRPLPRRNAGGRFPRAWSRRPNMASGCGRRAVYLNVQQLLPEDRTAQALSDLFDAPLICPASLVAWVGKKAQALRQVHQHIGVRVAEAKVRHPRVEEPRGRSFASPANCNGCTRLRAWPSPSIAPAKNAAPSQKICPEDSARKICPQASSCTTTSCLSSLTSTCP